MDFRDEQHFKNESGYEIDGTWYPRVTKIVNIKAKPALYRFYGNMPNFQEGERMKEQSAREGTLVHDAVESFLLGKTADVPSSIQPAIEAFREFMDMTGCAAHTGYVEYRLKHLVHRYAGTLDAVVTLEGKVGVLDIKTSQSIYRDYNLQTSAYMAAMDEVIPALETRWILRIDQNQTCVSCGAVLRTKGGRATVRSNGNGSGALRRCERHEWGPLRGRVELREFPEWRDDFEAFLGAKKLWEWEHEKWLKRVGYLA